MKTYNADEHQPANPRNNCICDDNTACYFHIKKGAWYSKYTDEQISPVTWRYALLPSTPTASFENLLVIFNNFGENTFRQEFSKVSPEKQQEIFDEWQFTLKSIAEALSD